MHIYASEKRLASFLIFMDSVWKRFCWSPILYSCGPQPQGDGWRYAKLARLAIDVPSNPEAAIEKLRMFKSRRREVALYHHLVNQHGKMETFPTLHTGSWI